MTQQWSFEFMFFLPETPFNFIYILKIIQLMKVQIPIWLQYMYIS